MPATPTHPSASDDDALAYMSWFLKDADRCAAVWATYGEDDKQVWRDAYAGSLCRPRPGQNLTA